MKRSSAHFSGLLILLAVFTLLFLMDSAAEAQLFIWSGDGQTGKVGETLPILLIIQILQFGIPQPGVLVNFDITDPDGAFTRASFVTDAFGLAGNFFTFKTQAGTYTVTVFAPGREALLGSVTFILTAEAGPPALVEVSAFDLDRLSELDELPADGESIGLIAASITDAFENPIEDTTITWTISPSGSGEIGETEHSEGGRYGAFFTAGTVPGEIAIQARTPNGVVGTVTLTLTDAGGAPLTQISFPNQPPPRMAVGSTFEFRVIGADAANRTQNLSAADVNWAVTGGIGAVSTSGVFTAQTVGSGTVTATLKSNPTVQRESSTITVIAGPAANLAPSISTSNLAAGSNGTAALTMTVTDAFGNRVLTETIILTISPQNGSITSPATHVGNGVYEATYTAGAAAGEITIEAKTSNGITQNVALRLTEIIAVPTFELSIANTKLVPDQPGFPIVTVLTLQGKNGFNSSITFDIGTGLPDGVDVDLNPKEVSLTPESPASFVQLQLKLPDALAPGDYPFTISAFAADGTQFRRLTLTLEIEAPEVTPAILTAVLDPSTDIPLGGSHKLFGNLIVSEPPDDLALENLVIGLTLTAPSGATQNFEGKTDANGRYQLENPFNLDELGTWKLRTNFAGNEQLGASQSVPISFVVIQGISQLTFDTEPTGQLGTAIEVTGRLNPPLEGERLTLKIRRPDGAAFTLTDITTETLGVFRHMLKLEIGGDWEMTATWAGNDQYKDVTQTLTISVSEEVGRAIVVLGGGNRQDNPAWNTFNGLAEYVYNIFLKRFGGDAEQILFLSPDPGETNGANRDTTLNGLNLAITDWAKSQVNPQIPLFIYLLSHNLGEQFLLEKRGDSEARLSASLLAEWLAELPQGTPVTIIIEACHSGNFIRSADNQPTGLVGPDRTLIVSARGDKQARILNNLSSFSKVFFDLVDRNETVEKAFTKTVERLKRMPQHRDQFPQIDADGDGVPSEPQDFATVANRYLPANVVSLGDPPTITDLTPATTLPDGVSSLTIEAELIGEQITRVFATIIPPNHDPTERIDDWNALTFDEVDLIRIDDRKYAGTYRNFSVPGDYTVIVNADNPDGGADPVQTTITVPGASVSAPWDVDGNGRVEVFDLVIVGSNFGQSGPGVRGDVDGNGVVDIFDLVQVGSHFGESTTPGAPPLMSVRSHSFEKQRRSSGEDVRSYESLQQALSQLESMSNSSRGVLIARDVLRAWLANTAPVVTETKLHPNYPNPFNPETWIPYQLASDAAVEISIYDVRGALVRRLDFGHQPAGYYTAQDKAAYWDGRSETGEWVSSGLYFYHLRAGHFTAVKRMVIRK